MADVEATTDSGGQQAKKMLVNGLDPSIGKATQFKPGVSGNPAGKPKGKHINTWIQELLEDEEFKAYIPDARDGWKEFKGAPIKAIVKAQAIKATQGDTKAFEALAKYGWPARAETDLTTNGKDLPTPILGGLSSQAGDVSSDISHS